MTMLEEKRLFKVEVEGYFIMYCAPSQAQAEAKRNLLGIESDDLGSTYVNEITKEIELPHDWRECYPYGDGSDETCLEIMKPIIDAERKRAIAEEHDNNQLNLDLD
jgi:hypothetical protein